VGVACSGDLGLAALTRHNCPLCARLRTDKTPVVASYVLVLAGAGRCTELDNHAQKTPSSSEEPPVKRCRAREARARPPGPLRSSS
jgi:hypothetical protein